jgi:CheY-like chemotaxis protein
MANEPGAAQANNLNLSLLLVEDNEVNREVALGMLQSLNCRADIAVNGSQGLEMAKAQRYDLILMDCQMPVMDGFAATMAIRQDEKANAKPRTPIVALTANAMEGDRERCLEVGMDGFLVKPFTIAQLREALLPYKQKSASMTTRPVFVTGLDHDEPTLSTRTMRAIQALKKPDLLPRLINIYLQRAPQLISAGNAAMLNSDLTALSTAAHELKSSSANLGGERLARVCKECEQAARQNDAAIARSRWQLVAKEFDSFQVALREWQGASRDNVA